MVVARKLPKGSTTSLNEATPISTITANNVVNENHLQQPQQQSHQPSPPQQQSTSSNVTDAFNPQSIGREFIRQYYTFLNRRPDVLYRFYNDDSSFLHVGHGGDNSVPVYGQDQISQKIMSFNFKDCHTKIKQMDCLETINKSVVIQVIGELSNNGQPLRKFFQTLVLAPRSPTNYYVRTNIFRYHDEVFTDEDECSEAEKAEATCSDQSPGQQEPFDSPLVSAATCEPENVEHADMDANTVNKPIAASVLNPSVQDAQMMFQSLNVNGVINGVSSNEQIENPENIIEQPQQPVVNKIDSSPTSNAAENCNGIADSQVDGQLLSTPQVTQAPPAMNRQVTPEPPVATVSSSEPTSYANMVSKNASPGGSGSVGSQDLFNSPSLYVSNGGAVAGSKSPVDGSSPGIPVTGNQRLKLKGSIHAGANLISPVDNGPNKPTGKPPLNNQQRSEKSGGTGGGNRNSGGGRGLNSGGKNRHDPRETTPSRSGDDGSVHGDGEFGERNRRPQWPDDQQVFVGNLMQDIDEDQLHKLLERFGNIVEVRINRTNQKQGRTPNYGFVTFDNPETVKRVTAEKRIYFNDRQSWFNVEEKRSQSNRGGNNGSGNGGQNNRNSSGNLSSGGGSRNLNQRNNGPGRNHSEGGQRNGVTSGGRGNRSSTGDKNYENIKNDSYNERRGGGSGGHGGRRVGGGGGAAVAVSASGLAIGGGPGVERGLMNQRNSNFQRR